MESPRAGEIAPQPWLGTGAARQRLDDVGGDGFVLIARGAAPAVPDFVRVVDAGDFDDGTAFDKWLGTGDAALIRPDRYVFGTGKADALIEALTGAL